MIKNLTARKIQTFNECPLHYQKQVSGLKGKENPGIPLEIYFVAMDALKEFEKKGTIKSEEFIEGFKTRCESKNLAVDSKSVENLTRILENIPLFPELTQPIDPSLGKFLKIKLSTHQGDCELLSVASRVDRTPGEEGNKGKVVASFFKTGRLLEVPSLKKDINFFIAYSSLKNNFPDNECQIQVYFLLEGEKKVFEFEPFELEGFSEQVSLFLRETKISTFEGKKSRGCYYCPFHENCEAWTERPYDHLGESLGDYSKRDRISYSRVGSYESCPYAYSKRYVEEDPRSKLPRPFFSLGKAFHELMERLYEFPKEYQIEFEKLVPIFQRIWSLHQEGFSSKEESEEWWKEGLIHLKNYYQAFIEGKKIFPSFLVEPYFEIPLTTPLGRKVILEGYIDRIDKIQDGFEIIDYKTESEIRTQEQVDKDLQLAIYFAAGKQFLGLDIKKLTLIFTATSDPLKMVVSTKRNQSEVQAVLEHVALVWDEICDAKEFPPKENKYCKTCLFKSECGLFN